MQSLNYARVVRKKMLAIVDALSLEQLNQIPAGCNNNIAWHLGHLVVSTQLLSYVRTGVQSERLVPFADKYRNGTKPELWIEQSEIDELKSALMASIDTLEQDYQQGIFDKTEAYATHTFGLMLHNIDDVLECCALHDTVHLGNVMMMKKMLGE
ncbi:MAG: DinB family protein [Bacteroidota bacterium]